jgi:type IV secretory pathway VirD2 relaxase
MGFAFREVRGGDAAMTEDDFEPRLGRIGGDRSHRRIRSVVGQVLAATARAGGRSSGLDRRVGSASFGRGRVAALMASHRLVLGARRVVVKARVARRGAGAGLRLHLAYLKREGVAADRAGGRLFDAAGEEASGEAFAGRCDTDRHHFRFIVSPENAEQLADLKAFTRDLMRHAEHDLGTRLDWVAADHWNTAHPHIHVLVRGVDADGADLVIAPQYIKDGLRSRASRLLTLELGVRSGLERQASLAREAVADRWTGLDRRLAAMAGPDRRVDLRPADRGGAGYDAALTQRLSKLEALGLAEPAGSGRWRLSPQAEPVLRSLGRRTDVIARLHAAMSAQAIDPSGVRPAPDEPPPHRWTGRLIGRGLDDELKGSAFVIIEGLDGSIRHAAVGDLAAVVDLPIGAVVEVQRPTAQGRARLWLQSDLTVEAQATAAGATWLDRQWLAAAPPDLAATGFGAQVREALEARLDHLVGLGLAERRGQGVRFAPGLLGTLTRRDLGAAARGLALETGLEARDLAEGKPVAGIYRRRLDLVSGRFAMMETDDAFALVPWRPALERHLGRWVQAERLPTGGVRWALDPPRGLGR